MSACPFDVPAGQAGALQAFGPLPGRPAETALERSGGRVVTYARHTGPGQWLGQWSAALGLMHDSSRHMGVAYSLSFAGS